MNDDDVKGSVQEIEIEGLEGDEDNEKVSASPSSNKQRRKK